MKVVFSSLPAYGHVYPMMPLALAFADAGHDVTVATGAPFVGRLPLPTTSSLPEGVTFKMFEREVFEAHPDLTGLDVPTALFGEVAPRYTAPTLRAVFERLQPDLVVYEITDVGAAVAADLLGIRAVTFGLGLWNPILVRWHETAARHQRDLWLAVDREPSTDFAANPGGYFDPMPLSIQHSPGALPARRFPIQPVSWSEPGVVPEWLTRDTGRPRVYVTLGTVAFGAVDVLRRAVTETAQHDVDVLVAVGPEGDPAALGELPGNVHVERFVPQAEVLPYVDLLVHHGGAGTMLGALSNGLPQLILPQAADQFFNAEAVTRIQAGRGLLNDAQVPGAIGAAVGELLTDGPERVAAKRYADEIAAMPTPADVVELMS
jgi:UDP:flavonoid glycosyltransferase YjiC (YdhE family)